MTVNHRRLLFASVLSLAVVLAWVPATGGYTTGVVNRPLTAGVADDSAEAIVGVTDPAPLALANGTQQTVNVLTVVNNRPVTLDVSVTVDDPADGPSTLLSVSGGTTTLGPGASTPVTATLSCESVGTETLDVTVTATRPGFRAVVIKTVEVSCT